MSARSNNGPPSFGHAEVIGEIEGPPVNVGDDWIVEFGAVGDELSLKVWRPGEPVPDDPQETIFDTTFTSGMFGVAANTLGQTLPLGATFDNIFFTVPEPSSFMLLGVATMGIAWVTRRGKGEKA